MFRRDAPVDISYKYRTAIECLEISLGVPPTHSDVFTPRPSAVKQDSSKRRVLYENTDPAVA